MEDKKKKIQKLSRILETFPPLTSRLTMQVSFFKKILKSQDRVEYFRTRDQKYSELERVQRNLKKIQVETLPYFCSWFSGFVEAEGCFCVRKDGKKSFRIGQKNDLY